MRSTVNEHTKHKLNTITQAIKSIIEETEQ